MPQLLTGTVSTDPDTGISYKFDGTKWVQISSESPVIQGGGSSVQDLISQITGSQNNVAKVNYPEGSFDYTPFQTFYDKAYQELAPYYKQLLNEAGGDLNVAIGNLERDYVTGTRTKVEDFMSSMDTLGVSFPKEDVALQGSLNKRGFALTENPQGQTQYAGGGLARSEVGTKDADQRLRTEAVQRTRQRGLESEAIKKLTGGQTAQQSYRTTTEAQQKEHETQSALLGSRYQSAEQLSKAAGIARAESGVDTGSSGGSSGSSNVNPDDVWAIKAAHPGYKSWNDENAIRADYRATRGVGK